MLSLEIKIYGKVQGVFFRDTAKQIADRIGIFGYVKNLPDGTLEILAQGNGEKLEKFIKWCKNGPKYAKVSKIEIEKIIKEELTDFKIVYS